jgi:hypothetical protein
VAALCREPWLTPPPAGLLKLACRAMLEANGKMQSPRDLCQCLADPGIFCYLGIESFPVSQQ